MYLLFGVDRYHLEKRRQALESAWQSTNGSGQFKVLRAGEVVTKDLSALVRSGDLFAQAKFLVWQDFLQKPSEVVLDLVATCVPDQAKDCWVFQEAEKVDKRSKLYKLLKKKGFAIEEFPVLNLAELRNWLSTYLKSVEWSLDYKAQNYLLENCQFDLWRLNSELNKVAQYLAANQQKEATLDDCQLLALPGTQTDIFKLMDYISGLKIKLALELLTKFWEVGVEPFYIFNMLKRQFKILIRLKEFANQNPNFNDQAAAKVLKIHPFVIKKTRPLLAGYSSLKLGRIYLQLLKLDLDLKSSRLSARFLVENFVGSLA